MDKIKDINNVAYSNSRIWDNSFLLFALLFSLSTLSYSQQQFNVFGEGDIAGIVSSENSIPFWFHRNISTRIGEYTNGAAYGKAGAIFEWGKSNAIEGGVSLMFRDGIEEKFQRENLFLEYKNNWLKATLGAKERPILYNGLSATNGNMIWSTNSRPMPGLILEANQPFRISNTFALDWGIAHYYLNDDRYVVDTRVHYKRLGLIVTFNEKHKLSGQLQHFAQWAGTSPEHGSLPSNFEAFVDVIFARSAKEDAPAGEEHNSVGNHLGSYLLKYSLKTAIGDFKTYHEHPFEDGSGTGFRNFPDGVWGLTFSPVNQKFISNFLYEYIDTTNQSGSSGVSGNDNYFNNGVYRSGWTYEGNVFGIPLIMVDKTIEITTNSSQIISNRARAHHFGIMGSFNKFKWIFKTTISKSFGTYATPFDPMLTNWYNYVSFSYTTTKYGILTIQGGADTSNITDTIIGGGLSYKYSF